MPTPTKKHIERASQLDQAKKILSKLRGELRALEKNEENHSNLSSHLEGFYAEIATLAKGKTLVEATTLVVDQMNDIIRDAKKIVQNDVYLDRIKEFVPAGNNPVYPDVLIVARAARQSLKRWRSGFDDQKKTIWRAVARAETVIGALECFLSGEENAELALREDVERFVDGDNLDTSCFYEDDEGNERFDFDEFDSQSVENYIRGIVPDLDADEQSGGDATEVEDSEEEEQESEE